MYLFDSVRWWGVGRLRFPRPTGDMEGPSAHPYLPRKAQCSIRIAIIHEEYPLTGRTVTKWPVEYVYFTETFCTGCSSHGMNDAEDRGSDNTPCAAGVRSNDDRGNASCASDRRRRKFAAVAKAFVRAPRL